MCVFSTKWTATTTAAAATMTLRAIIVSATTLVKITQQSLLCRFIKGSQGKYSMFMSQGDWTM
jgi:hypothetical protein